MAFQWNLCVFVSFAFVAMVTARPSTRRLDIKDDHEVKIEDSSDSVPEDFNYEMPVHYFARHVLCHDKEGKIAFYNVMSKALPKLNGAFIESFVFDLCRLHSRNDIILDRWVKELFDSDSNGYITQAEMHYYL